MNAQTVTIVGVNGGFGSLFASRLAGAGWTLHGVDRAPAARHPEYLASYHHLRPEGPNDIAAAAFADSRVWLLCTPERGTFSWTERLLPGMAEGRLCLDILSVKEPIVEHVGRMGFAGEYLSLHPMFAPGVGFADQAVAVVPVREGPVAAEFCGLLADWGARLVRLDAENHDRATAILQAGVHAALLALARATHAATHAATRDTTHDTTHDTTVNRDLLRELGTPVSRPVFEAIDRILRGQPETYQAIQDRNRYAEGVRRTMVQTIEELVQGQNADRLFRQLR
ncbi:hypothetical protein CSB20_12740 [bacterium DOLZORAL124_64_63]|nr:MAG: hypothetical protein CSB20_12740 [bacterium DOLZORAL124_64_63]